MVTASMARVRCRLQEWLNESEINYSQLSQKIELKSGKKVSVGAIRRLAKEQFERIECDNALDISLFFGKKFEDLFYTEV